MIALKTSTATAITYTNCCGAFFIMEKEVRITVSAPVECTDEQFQEWVEYCLGCRGSIPISNPLHEYEIEVEDVDVF